tara:strand:- start:899 stop:1156 length:258 start_codon:yes stop_codon:yes gene_type:complete
MKIFIYKLIISLVGIFILFQLTIGLAIKEVEKNIIEFSSKESVSIYKEKIREEINEGIKKDRILDEEDAKLLKLFYEKIKQELNN